MEESSKRKDAQRKHQMKKLESILRNDKNFDEDSANFILEEQPMELLYKLKIGELTAVKVLKAFQFKALQITKNINCVTEFVPEAQEWAEICDKIPEDERLPLHGLPVSIKESIDIQGMDTSLGLAKHLYNPAAIHSTIVQILIENGAVPFCKTNVPQCLLSFCCTNPVFGTTLNPHDATKTRTPGGSSGGEAALIAAGGSVVGIGSDLAGSARVPASMSGCFGIKFTSTRVSSKGFKKGLNGMVGVSSSPGVLGRDIQIVSLVSKIILETKNLNLSDASIVPISWNELVFNSKEKLTFGYFEDTEFFPCTPGVKRAVLESKIALEKMGHKTVPFKIIDPKECYTNCVRLTVADGGSIIREHLNKEIIDPSLKKGLLVILSTGLKKKILESYISYVSPIMSTNFSGNCYKVRDLWEKLNERNEALQEIKNKMMKDDVDLLIHPTFACPAPQHYVPSLTGPACFYTVFANYCDLASGTVPVTKENEEDQRQLKDYSQSDEVLKIIRKATEGAIGMPIGVTVTGLPCQEELVLRGMQALENALKNHNGR